MKHKKLICSLCICTLAVASAIGVWAINKSEVSVVNNISTSIVDIDLKTYTEEDNKIIPIEEKQKPLVVMPATKISQIPRISNKAIDCYIRATIDIENKNNVDYPITVDNLSGFTDDWIKNGEYYYYTKIFTTGSTVDLFDTITVPEEWDTQYEGGKEEIKDYYTQNAWDVTVKVDAIQSNNFTPDFENSNPWGEEGKDYEIQECIHEDGYDVTTFRAVTPSELSVVYEGDSQKLITSQDDFFSGFATLTPGDEIEGIFTLRNTADSKQTYFFKTEVLEPDNDLLNQMELTITTTTDGKQVYSGSLNSKELKEYMELCKLGKGKSENVSFRVSVPKELDNQYTLNTGKVKWYFKTTAEEKEIDKPAPVKTGDALFVENIIWAIVLVVAVIFLIVMKKKGK